ALASLGHPLPQGSPTRGEGKDLDDRSIFVLSVRINRGPRLPSFTPHQDTALSAVADWLKSKPGKGGVPHVFRLFGYAGTGKTMLARHIADGVDGKVLFAAFTGKAAQVMRSRGCIGASTIHSLIYRARE